MANGPLIRLKNQFSPEVRYPFTEQPKIPYDVADPLFNAIKQFGSALSSAGRAAASASSKSAADAEAEKKAEDTFNAKMAYAQYAREIQNSYYDAEQRAPAGAPEFAQTFEGITTSRSSEVLSSLSSQGINQDVWRATALDMVQLNTQYQGKALAFQFAAANDQRRADITTATSDLANSAIDNPMGVQTQLNALRELINNSGLPPTSMQSAWDAESARIRQAAEASMRIRDPNAALEYFSRDWRAVPVSPQTAAPILSYRGAAPGTPEYDQGIANINPKLLGMAQSAYGALGLDGLTINSGFRSVDHNRAVGGAEHSQHLGDGSGISNAIDLSTKDMSNQQKADLVRALSAAGVGGIGIYEGHIHADVGPVRQWSKGAMPAWAQDAIAEHVNGTATVDVPLRNDERAVVGLMQGIAGAESSHKADPYIARGPDTIHDDGTIHNAYGKYQVMDYNVGPWTQKYFGTRLTPQQFLANPQAQEITVAGRFKYLLDKYDGDWKDAASEWFTGRPYAVAGGNASDSYHTLNEYLAKVEANLGTGQVPSNAYPGVRSRGGNPLWDVLTPEERIAAMRSARDESSNQQAMMRAAVDLGLDNWEAAAAQGAEPPPGTPTAEQISAAYANDPIKELLNQARLDNANMMQPFIKGSATASEREIEDALQAIKPQPGQTATYAADVKNWEAMRNAADTIRAARKDDIAKYAQTHFSRIGEVARQAASDPGNMELQSQYFRALNDAYNQMEIKAGDRKPFNNGQAQSVMDALKTANGNDYLNKLLGLEQALGPLFINGLDQLSKEGYTAEAWAVSLASNMPEQKPIIARALSGWMRINSEEGSVLKPAADKFDDMFLLTLGYGTIRALSPEVEAGIKQLAMGLYVVNGGNPGNVGQGDTLNADIFDKSLREVMGGVGDAGSGFVRWNSREETMTFLPFGVNDRQMHTFWDGLTAEDLKTFSADGATPIYTYQNTEVPVKDIQDYGVPVRVGPDEYWIKIVGGAGGWLYNTNGEPYTMKITPDTVFQNIDMGPWQAAPDEQAIRDALARGEVPSPYIKLTLEQEQQRLQNEMSPRVPGRPEAFGGEGGAQPPQRDPLLQLPPPASDVVPPTEDRIQPRQPNSTGQALPPGLQGEKTPTAPPAPPRENPIADMRQRYQLYGFSKRPAQIPREAMSDTRFSTVISPGRDIQIRLPMPSEASYGPDNVDIFQTTTGQYMVIPHTWIDATTGEKTSIEDMYLKVEAGLDDATLGLIATAIMYLLEKNSGVPVRRYPTLQQAETAVQKDALGAIFEGGSQ